MNDLGISSAPAWRDKRSSRSYSPAGTPRTQRVGGNSYYPRLNYSCDDDSAFLPGPLTTTDGDGESRKLANMVRKVARLFQDLAAIPSPRYFFPVPLSFRLWLAIVKVSY